MRPPVLRASLSMLLGLLLSSLSASLAASPPDDTVHFCLPFDYEQWRRENPRPAAKRAAELNVGEPRTVRMIYFVPNDRPYRQKVVDSMKVVIREIQTFYGEQMQERGYSDMTFAFEVDDHGEPVVHRVDGQHPDSGYLDDTFGTVLDEIEQVFDLHANIYLAVIDNGADLIIDKAEDRTGLGRAFRGLTKSGGFALVTGGFSFATAAHELGHTFGLSHDFHDRAYIMSYGGSRDRLSTCHAEFLAAHPYFNSAVSIAAGTAPVIQLTSSPEYPAGSESTVVRLQLNDSDGLHQVFLMAEESGPSGTGTSGYFEVWACRNLAGEKSEVVQFDYDGYGASGADWGRIRRLSDQDRYRLEVLAVDIAGNMGIMQFELSQDTEDADRRRAATIRIVGGDNQEGAPGTVLADPLVVEVRDQNGQLLPGATIQLGVTEGDARLSGRYLVENATTDATGRATLTLTLGADPGTNIVRVSAPQAPECVPVIFSATGIGPPTVNTLFGDSQIWRLPNGAIGRLGKGRVPHETDRAASFSPDGQHLAVASGIGVWLYDTTTLRELALFEHESSVLSVSFSPGGTLLASASDDGDIRLWDVETGQLTATLEGHTYLASCVSFSRDGTLLASGDYLQTVKLWEVATGREVATWEGERQGTGLSPVSVAFSPDGTTLAAGFMDNTVRLWNLRTFKSVAILSGHRLMVRSVAFSPMGTVLASASADGDIRLWDVETRESTPLKGHRSEVTSVAFSRDGTMLASGSREAEVKIWNVTTGSLSKTLTGVHTSWVTSVAFSPEGTVVSASVDGTVALWDVVTGNAATFPGLGHVDVGSSVSFSLVGKMLASGGEDGTVKLWDVDTGRNTKSLGLRPWGIDVVAFSPDGTTLASGSSDNTIDLWDVTTSTKIASFKRGKGQILSLAFSQDGTLLAAGDPGGIVLWDVARVSAASAAAGGEVVWGDEAARYYVSTPIGYGWVWSLAFSGDGKMLASGSGDGRATLWDASTLSHLATLGTPSVGRVRVSLSSDLATLAVATADYKITLWDVPTRESTATLWATSSFMSVSFSPDGTILAGGLWDGAVRLWDVASLESVATLEGHTSSVVSMSFSSDGTVLASGSEDGTILLWDMQFPQPHPQMLTKVAGPRLQGPTGAPLPVPLVVEVRDQNGNPLAGVQVTFAVTAGDGALSDTTATTDADGRAATTLTLGSQPGTNTVEATVAGLEPVTFTATARIREDFDGNGTVGFGDFVQFAARFGLNQDNEGYDARFDLDGNGAIGFSDFLIFAGAFGNSTASS